MPGAGETIASDAPGMRKVARNTAYLLAGEVGVKILSFAFTVLIVRRLGVEDFGRFSAAVAFVGLFAILTDLGTTTFALREMARAPELAGALATKLMGLRLALSVPVAAFVPWLAWMLGEPQPVVSAIVVASLALILHAVIGPLQSLLLSGEHFDVVSMSHVVNQMVFLVLGAPALIFGGGFIGLLVVQLVALVASLGVSAWAAHSRTGFRPVGSMVRGWWNLLRAGFPFLIGQVSDVVSNRFSITFIFLALSEMHVGWYSVSSGLVTMALPLAQSLGLAVFPTLVRQHDAGGEAVAETTQRSLRYLMLVSLPIAVGGFLLAYPLVTVLYTDAFAPSVPVLRILVWTLPALFAIELIGRVAFIQHREKAMARIYLAATLLGVVLTVVLVEVMGLVGAALAVLISRLFLLVATVRLVNPSLALGSGALFLRTALAAALMGVGVWGLVAALPHESMPPAVTLVLAVAFGVGLYAAIAHAMGVVTVADRRFLLGTAAAVFRRLARA